MSSTHLKVNKTILLFKCTPILAVALFTQGCVGIVTRGMNSKTFAPATVAEKPAPYSVAGSTRTFGPENPTSLWLRQHWGEPSYIKQITRPTASEVWTYNFDHKWCGVIPIIVVPVPLLLPVGRERVIFQIQNGKVASAKVTTLGGHQTWAGLSSEGPAAINSSW